jgi:hypothetical protein
MKPRRKRAGHFLLIPELLYSPPNDAIIRAYIENGYAVDVYAPGKLPESTEYGEIVNTYEGSYTWIWVLKNAVRFKWLRYDCFSGTSEDPLAVVGLLSFLYKKPCFSLVDEIKSGGYRGNRSERWKSLCKWSIRHSSFSIVNDESRIRLLKDYVALKKTQSVQVFPGCFIDPPKRTCEKRKEIRKRWGFTETDFVIGSSGGFNMTAGADWLIRSIGNISDLRAVIQPLGVSPLSMFLLQHLPFSDRIYVEIERLGWREAWLSAQGLDVGLCIYSNQAPQFQNMGVSSNRLCMFIAMGVPVIASRQESFRFLEKYNCGVLVNSYDEFVKAIMLIRVNHREMVSSCRVCFEEYIRPGERYKTLVNRINKLSRGSV